MVRDVSSRIRQFLTPGWVLTAVFALIFAYVAFTVLAPWQLGKNEATQNRNDQLRVAFEEDPVQASSLYNSDGTVDADDEWRRVILTGHYLPEDEIILRNRPVDQSPAMQALTAFETTDGSVFLVNRGWELPVDGNVPNYEEAPSGQVTIQGFARKDEMRPERAPIEGNPPQVYGINSGLFTELTDQEVNPDYVLLDSDQPGGLRNIPLPSLESGPYLSYGIQWIFFGIAAPAAVIWFIYAEIRERRREREEQAEHAAALHKVQVSAGGDDDHTPTTEDTQADQEATEARRAQRMAKRYGSSSHNRYVDRGERF